MEIRPKIVQYVLKNPSRLNASCLKQEDEIKIFQDAKNFLEEELKLKIEILKADEYLEGEKAKQALPGKPAILLE